MTITNKTYEAGYSDAYHNVARNMDHFLDEGYEMGWEDGHADRLAGAEPRGVKSAFIRDDFEDNNEPPKGYRWLGEHRTPLKGEVYLTKAGNAGVAKTEAKNGRQRHILYAISQCGGTHYGSYGQCQFAQGHLGRCSCDLVK